MRRKVNGGAFLPGDIVENYGEVISYDGAHLDAYGIVFSYTMLYNNDEAAVPIAFRGIDGYMVTNYGHRMAPGAR